jgi:hypothetical protein
VLVTPVLVTLVLESSGLAVALERESSDSVYTGVLVLTPLRQSSCISTGYRVNSRVLGFSLQLKVKVKLLVVITNNAARQLHRYGSSASTCLLHIGAAIVLC